MSVFLGCSFGAPNRDRDPGSCYVSVISSRLVHSAAILVSSNEKPYESAISERASLMAKAEFLDQ